jgi:hypothetical protein
VVHVTNSRGLLATGARRDELHARGSTLPAVTLDGARLADFEALVTGLFCPLNGFGVSLGPDGAWCGVPPLEVPLAVRIADGPGPHVALKDPEGVLLGVLDVFAQSEAGTGRLLSGTAPRGTRRPASSSSTPVAARTRPRASAASSTPSAKCSRSARTSSSRRRAASRRATS